MTAVAHTSHGVTNVMLLGPDRTVLDAISRLLSLDRSIEISDRSAPHSELSSPAAPDVVLVTGTDANPRALRSLRESIRRRSPSSSVVLLESLKHLSVAAFLETIKSLNVEDVPGAVTSDAHEPRDMRRLLSQRELEVVRLVAEGLSNKEISTRLLLSDKTVKNHISHILSKLNFSARTQVAVHAIRHGFV